MNELKTLSPDEKHLSAVDLRKLPADALGGKDKILGTRFGHIDATGSVGSVSPARVAGHQSSTSRSAVYLGE